ncbi:hypothetical protein NC651_040579 [Populus alba x Populus x berolinensis]|nr:hypothetical protein NC651_040579 [Populus alba x Populus x berolinensis]
MRRLTSFKISNNNVFGKIYHRSSQLHLIDLSSNHLEETIPRELGGLKLVSNLTLSNNYLPGAIKSLGCFPILQSLDLLSNNLSGSIPNQLGKCSNLLLLKLKDLIIKDEIKNAGMSGPACAHHNLFSGSLNILQVQ